MPIVKNIIRKANAEFILWYILILKKSTIHYEICRNIFSVWGGALDQANRENEALLQKQYPEFIIPVGNIEDMFPLREGYENEDEVFIDLYELKMR